MSYGGKLYQAKYANPGYNPTISTYYWAPYTVVPATSAPAPSCSATAYSSSTRYTTGNVVSYGGQQYVARGVNFKGIVPTDTRYWSVQGC